jgi:hypothetical protein
MDVGISIELKSRNNSFYYLVFIKIFLRILRIIIRKNKKQTPKTSPIKN